MELIPLNSLKAGETGLIRDIDGTKEFVARLSEMGLSPGTVIRMIQPGAPCILGVKDQRLSLRGDEELGIYVELARSGSQV